MASQSSTIRLQVRVHSLQPVEAAPLLCRLSTLTVGAVLLEPFQRPPTILSSCGTCRRTNISRHVIGDSCPGTLLCRGKKVANCIGSVSLISARHPIFGKATRQVTRRTIMPLGA
eukprot:scaffold467539_cov83-Attheya_sp.AAC.1